MLLSNSSGEGLGGQAGGQAPGTFLHSFAVCRGVPRDAEGHFFTFCLCRAMGTFLYFMHETQGRFFTFPSFFKKNSSPSMP